MKKITLLIAAVLAACLTSCTKVEQAPVTAEARAVSSDVPDLPVRPVQDIEIAFDGRVCEYSRLVVFTDRKTDTRFVIFDGKLLTVNGQVVGNTLLLDKEMIQSIILKDKAAKPK